jgi:hypothetical protein
MNRNKVTYKQRFYLLVAAVVLSCFVAYFVAIKQSVNLYKSNIEITSELNNLFNAPVEIANITHEINAIDSLIGREFSETDFQSLLLDFIIIHSPKNVSIFKLHDIHSFQQGNYMIFTEVIELEGPYKGLLEIVNKFEKEINVLKLKSAKFYVLEDKKVKRNKLLLSIIIQSYKKI